MATLAFPLALRSLIDSAPVGMLVVDHELRVEQANPAAAALFGCRPEELIGNIPEDRLVERNLERWVFASWTLSSPA